MAVTKIEEHGFSDDYQRLVELMKTQSVICVLDYSHCRDVCQTIYDNTFYGEGDLTPESFQLSARGIGYIWTDSVDEFIAFCKAKNVRFLDGSTGA